MTSHSLRYLANCSMLFTEVPAPGAPRPPRRPPASTRSSSWWPWPDQPVPGDAEIDAFVTAVQDAGVQDFAGLNFFAGDLAGPDCGVLSIPSRSQQFRDNVEVTLGIGERLGTQAFNALYGNRVGDATPGQQDDLGAENLAYAAKAADRLGATVLVEPVSGPKPYPLRTADDAVGVVDRVRATRTTSGFLCDLFPPGQQRRRRRRGHRQPRRPRGPRPDRRRPRSWRAGFGRPAARRVAGRAPRSPGMPATSASSTSPRPQPSSRASPGSRSRVAETPDPQGDPHNDQRRLHRPRHHGQPMAGHLAKAGHTVTGINRHPNYEDLEAAGGKGAGSIKEAVTDADVVCIMVPDSPDVREVLEGEGGVFDSAKPGTLIVDFSSIRPDVTVELAKAARSTGFRLIDAPVSGGGDEGRGPVDHGRRRREGRRPITSCVWTERRALGSRLQIRCSRRRQISIFPGGRAASQ